MKQFTTIAFALILTAIPFSSTIAAKATQHWAIIITSEEKETAWNALRVANYSLKQGVDVSIFFLGKGVESAVVDDEKFNIQELTEEFVDAGGKVYACKACLKLHKMSPTETCPFGTLKILYDMIKNADRVLTL